MIARLFLIASYASLLFLTSAALSGESSARSYQGVVEMAELPNGDLQLALDETGVDGNPDGLADHLFVLELETPSQVKSLSLTDAVVTFAPGRLTLRYGNHQVLRWRLIPEDESHKANRNPNILFGGGLSHHTGDFENSPAELVLEDPAAAGELLNFTPDGGGGVTCDAGGVGASKCSILCLSGSRKQCSVECSSSSKFACCNCLSGGASCKCWTLQSRE